MSRNQRIALVVAAVAVAVVAFVIARPGGDDDEGSNSTATPSTETQAKDGTDGSTETTPAQPEATRIAVKGGVVVGGAKTIRADRGDTVRIVVSSDAPDEIHLHGYDIEREASPGKPARFNFKADAEGAFELESHAAEDAGKEPVVAHLLIGPS
jgi:FtsP/CotA-like multicopper oxidase with cupredoxin domain